MQGVNGSLTIDTHSAGFIYSSVLDPLKAPPQHYMYMIGPYCAVIIFLTVSVYIVSVNVRCRSAGRKIRLVSLMNRRLYGAIAVKRCCFICCDRERGSCGPEGLQWKWL